MTDDQDMLRAAYREFVRTHHPDVGGDPDEFIAGLDEFRGRLAVRTDAAPDDPRFDAPVVVVTHHLGHRLLLRVGRWARRRFGPPRVW